MLTCPLPLKTRPWSFLNIYQDVHRAHFHGRRMANTSYCYEASEKDGGQGCLWPHVLSVLTSHECTVLKAGRS